MIFEQLKLNAEVTDDDFNSIYPEEVKMLSRKHWTSIAVAKQSSEFLVQRPGTRVLDIGSGAGKFCLIGATNTAGYFTGVEQRSDLVKLSNKISASHAIHNTTFIHANITSISFSNYDAFYFYNSFYENIDVLNRIDDTIKLDPQLYSVYSRYITKQFASLPFGTRLVTYHGTLSIIPRTFRLRGSLLGGALKFWEKAKAGIEP